MRKVIQAIASMFIVLIAYISYVLDNFFCIFGVGTKLPFKDFLGTWYLQKLFIIRLVVVLFVCFMWKLIF